jgi:NADP-dependent 3-hydroxy acid dehydrogenase YdfG
MAGKIVLITGASSGIGRATAFAFARQGARLLLCARRLDVLLELETPLMEAGAAGVLLFQLDVRQRDLVDETLAGLPPEWSEISVLVNNAGLSRGMVKVYEQDPDDWDDMIDTNIKGLLAVTRAVVPGMVARGAGHVINLGSTAGHMTYANGAVYCASKAAVIALS